jgi:hypothetical protein
MMNRFFRKLTACTFATIVTISSVAASPCNDAADLPDTTLWQVTNPDCWWDFVLWQYKAYRMFNSDWNGWGFNAACDIDQPYPKGVNGSYLLTYGLTESNWQWHGTIDYRNAGEAWSTPAHNKIKTVPANTTAWLAQATSGGLTRMSCLQFNDNAWSNSPTTRAGDYIHEGWHHWQFKRNYSGHMNGPIGACTQNGAGCDWYYWHGVGAYAFGEAHKYTTDGTFFHSPNQIQSEFLCDVDDYGEGWLPAIIATRARSEANNRLSGRFRNAVGYRCGDARPW